MRKKQQKTILGPFATEKEADLAIRYAEGNGTHKATKRRKLVWIVEAVRVAEPGE